MTIKRRYIPEDEAFLQQLIVPEEDRHRFTTAKWSGGYRWFKSNITPIEHYERVRTPTMTTTRRAG